MMRRPLLLPLVPVYAAGLWVKRRWLARGEAKRLSWPVVSVGSLSAGGAGKTPVVLALAQLLERYGYGVDVLSRGYGRGGSTVEQVEAAGADPKAAERFGDEPLLLARARLPVFVGAERYAAGRLAETTLASGFSPGKRWVHLLDDGFQHRRLARCLDVVLLTAEDATDWLLPAGNLREPLTRLRQAGVIVLREEEEAALRPVLGRVGAGAVPVWVVRRRLSVDVGGRRVVAFCGIARPEGFFRMLRACGVELVETVVFRDHHISTQKDLTRLVKVAAAAGADGFVTTEKDAVKLAGRLPEMTVARLRVEFVQEDAVLRRMELAVESTCSHL